MNAIRTCVFVVTLVAASAPAALADSGQAAPPAPQQQQQPPPPPPPPPPDITYKETVVVSASKTEEKLVNAPATMSVIGSRALEVAPSNSYSELLKSVPGVNITQISARDININSRAATSSLATSQLAVLDGRSLYQDFFGFVMWDFMPVNLNEIKRIEVIRGPASAVWGANALNGVINVITKTPREMQGTSFVMGVNQFGREYLGNGAQSGSAFYLSGTHAQAMNDKWAYKLSLGTYNSESFGRPTGFIQGTTNPYPTFVNTGTSQPKGDLRIDYDKGDGSTLSMSGGIAGTDGIMHSGIGPFDINTGTTFSYGKVTWSKGARRLQAFVNILDGDAPNLLAVDTAGAPIKFAFKTQTFDIEAGDSRALAGRHVLTYGGNLRYNKFNLTIAPPEDSRTEGGVYLQDEIFMNDHVRLVAGARVDKFSSIDSAVFSPRVALLLKPTADHTFRVTYNRAFRAPSMINNNLNVTITNPLPFAAINPAFAPLGIFRVPTTATGNADLTEEYVDAYEVSYTGNIQDRVVVSAAAYYTKFTDEIFFTETAQWVTPPPGWPASLGGIPGAAIWGGLRAAGVVFPSAYSYRNLGEVKNKGIELGIDASINSEVSFYSNYSYQEQPEPNFALSEINLPSRHRINAGLSFMNPKTFGSLSVSYQSSAFWQDVLDSRYHGRTDQYTSVNASLGTKWANGRYSVTLKGTNLFDADILQHVFGDVQRRMIGVEFRVNLPK